MNLWEYLIIFLFVLYILYNLIMLYKINRKCKKRNEEKDEPNRKL